MKHSRRMPLSLVLLGLLVASAATTAFACNTASSSAGAPAGATEAESAAIVLPQSNVVPVPVVRRQETCACGPSSLAASLAYFRVLEEGDENVGAPCRMDARAAVDPAALADVARSFGLDAELTHDLSPEESLQRLVTALDAKEAVILEIASGAQNDEGHFVAVLGIDRATDATGRLTGNAYVMDPDAMADDHATAEDPDRYSWLPAAELIDRWRAFEGASAGGKTRVKSPMIRISDPAGVGNPLLRVAPSHKEQPLRRMS